jgi:hypothetical protein
MAPIIIPIVIAAGAAGFGVALGAVTVGAAVLSVAVTALTAGAGYLLRDPITGDPNPYGSLGPMAAPANAQRNLVAKQATPPRRIVYGRCRVAGALIFQDNDNPYLYLMLALSDGEVEGVTAYYIGDENVPIDAGEPVTGSRFEGRLLFSFREGSAAQAADSVITGAFPLLVDSNFRQRGVAVLTARLDWGSDAANHQALWGDSITPSVMLEGAKVVDPRITGTSPDSSTARTFSSNPALCVADILVRAWDMALDYDDINWATVEEAADDCDATTTYGAESRPIFEISGVFQSGAELAGQLAAMLSAMGGSVYFADGKYCVRADKARSSVWTITDDDIIEIGEFVHEAEQGDAPNTIKARFQDADDDGVSVFTEPYEAAGASGEPTQEVVLSLPFTARTHSAQIIAYRELIRARDGRALSLQVSDAGLYLEPLDVVTISSTAAPWLNGVFQVIQTDLESPGCRLQLRGYDADAYTDPGGYLVSGMLGA